MKIFSFIFTAYVLFLSVEPAIIDMGQSSLPCQQTNCPYSKSVPKKNNSRKENNKLPCTPLCMCPNMQLLVPSIAVFSNEHIYSVQKKVYPYYSEIYFFNSAVSIWHPPKFS